MSEEWNIFDNPPPHKLHRRDDPQTSRDAAKHIAPRANRMQQAVYDIIKSYGDGGCIGWEVINEAQKQNIFGRSQSSVTGRFSELERKGLIKYTGEKRAMKDNNGMNLCRPQRVMIALNIGEQSE